MAWKKPLKAVVAREKLPPKWRVGPVNSQRDEWRLTLECGHTVKRITYGNKPLPLSCHCSLCSFQTP